MRRRIVIALGLLLALCLTGDVIALLSLDHSIRRFDELAESHRLQSLRASLSFSGLQVERDSLARLVGLPGSEQQLLESIWIFKDSLRQCRNCHHQEELKGRLAGVKDNFDAWLTRPDSSYSIEPGGGVSTKQYRSIESLGRLVKDTVEMVENAHEKLNAKSDEVQSSVHRAWVILCLTLVGVLVFGGMVAFNLRRNLTRPLSGLLELTQQYGRGDPDRVPPISGDEEFRLLGEAFRRAYGELRSAQEGVLEAQKMAAIGQLAAGVAHEVLNPLAGISCLVQLMSREARGEREAERFDLIMEHIRRISGILREFQSFSRPLEKGKLSPVSVPRILDQTTELLGYDRRSEGITIVRDYSSDLEPIVADADRLSVVFTNIMLNALDALGSGDGPARTLTVSARREGEVMLLRFADNGPGMTEHDIANAFEPFFTTKDGGAGSGLGLWVCYETIRGHQGKISLANRSEGGLTVTIELPCGTGPPEGTGAGMVARS